MSDKQDTTIVFTTETAPKDLGNPEAIASEVRQLIQQGLKPEDACAKLGLDLKRNAELRKQMRLLVAETGDVPMQVQKALVRAARLKLMVKNVHSDDLDAQKIALQAAKQIGSDPDVGLNQPAAVIALIDLGSLEEVFDHLPDENIIDVEVVEED